MKKRIISIAVAIGLIAIVVLVVRAPKKTDDTVSGPVSQTLIMSPLPAMTAQETPNYDAWKKALNPLNRYLALDKDCTSSVPSQVTYPNNTQIMLDNTASDVARVLKIGSR